MIEMVPVQTRTLAARSLPFILLVLMAIAGGVPQAGAAAPGSILTRPGAEDGPIRISVGLYLVDLVDIDDAERLLTADFVVWVSWSDPRLAKTGTALRRYPSGEVWTPGVIIRNERSLRRSLPEIVDVDADGNVLYRQRYTGTVTSITDLSDFPFDRQVLRIQVVAGGLTTDEVEFEIQPTRTGRADELSVIDWSVGEVEGHALPYLYAADNRLLAGFALDIPVKRYTGYYAWKLILPLVVVVFMSWTVFWIDPTLTASQIAVSTTSILTLIAYQFVLSRLVPELSYLTRLDRFTIGSTILVFLALIEVVATAAVAVRGREASARRTDRVARVAFPLAFVGLLLFAFVF
jgi:hypothetical protein